MSIHENYQEVIERINNAKARSKYKQDVTLLAVTKTVDIERMKEIVDCGIFQFGENKVQEILKKYPFFDGDSPAVYFHMIGHLQTNKVKDIIDKVVLIHSIDRKTLMDEIEKRAEKKNITVNGLLQLNISKEDSKSGFYLEDLEECLDYIEQLKFLKIKGLMTMAPFYEDNEQTRIVFKKAYEIFHNLKIRSYQNIEMQYLSMGMSHDYEIAIEEGANIVRIGTALFGKRNYNL